MRKTILITGCSSGLGEKLAEALSSRGYKVYAGARNPEDIKIRGKLIRPVKLDITKEAQCEEAIRYIIEKEGKIDVLINNAGYTIAGPTSDFTPQDYLNILDTNAVGAFRLVRLVLPQMKKQKSGKIINITSLNGLISLPNFGLYSSSKFALEALGQALRYELAKDNISVTNVAPGAILSKSLKGKSLPHRSAREKFLLLKILMPMITQEEVVRKINSIIDNPHPPARAILGRDAKITYFLQKVLPFSVWDKLLLFVWNKK